MIRYLIFSVIVIAGGLNIAAAADECTEWMPQPDGSSWRICTNAQGHRYCQELRDGKINKVSCTAGEVLED